MAPTATTASKIIGYAAKAVGITGLGIALYDANHMGKRTAGKTKNVANANAGYDYFRNTQYQVNGSHMTTNYKKKLFNWELRERIRGRHNYNKGYIKGFFNNLGQHIVPVALSTVALVTKGLPSKISAGGLGLYAIYSTCAHLCSHLGHKS